MNTATSAAYASARSSKTSLAPKSPTAHAGSARTLPAVLISSLERTTGMRHQISHVDTQRLSDLVEPHHRWRRMELHHLPEVTSRDASSVGKMGHRDLRRTSPGLDGVADALV